MRLLLDTHALIWWMLNGSALSAPARTEIADPANEVFVSPVSAFEIATKVRQGKLDEAAVFATNFEQDVAQAGFRELPLKFRHAHLAGGFRFAHKDPFDRMLIAQAMAENMMLVSHEQLFDGFAVVRIW